MSITQVITIARREYLARVRNKWFIVSTLMVPLFVVLPMSMGQLIGRADIDELRLTLLDVGTGHAEAIAQALREIEDFTVRVVDVQQVQPAVLDVARATLRAQILDDQIDGYLLIELDEQLGIRGRYYSSETGNILILRSLERSIRAVALEIYLAGSGLDSERVQALVRWDMSAVRVSDKGEEEGGFRRVYMSTFILGMILYITVLMGGQQMGSSIVEEKSSRIIELVLGAVTATEFMAGKVAGVLGAALTQLAVWIGMALLGSLYVLPALAIGAAMEGVDLTDLLDPGLLFYFSILYLLGYLFYSVLYAVAASMCSTTEEFQQIAFPLMMPIMMSFFFVFYVITNPATLISRIVSLLPPATPLVMMARINVLRPPLWEIWLGIFLLAAASGVAVWLSGKIFRFTLLMQGKRPTLGTVFRLMRAA